MRPPTQAADRLRAAAEGARRRAPTPVIRVASRTAEDLQRVELFDRAMTLAAQAFTSLFPLVIALAALFPDNAGSTPARISAMLGIPASATSVIEQSFPVHPDTRGTFGILGLLIVVVSATSFSRALGRMYSKVWRVAAPGGRTGVWRWVAALFGVTLTVITLKLLHLAIDGPFAVFGEPLLAFAVGTVVWTWAPWLLLAGQISWRLLLPGGMIMGLCTVGMAIAGGIYLPRAFESASNQFGALGIAFTSISWLFVGTFALVCSTVLGAALARDESRLARILVGQRADQ